MGLEAEMLCQKGKKRQFVEISDDGGISEVYRFRILLPNGTTVRLNVRDPGPKMPLADFIALVKDEYFRVLRHSESMQCKRPINWKIGSLSIQDTNDFKMTSTVNFKNFRQQKCHILVLNDGSGGFAEIFEGLGEDICKLGLFIGQVEAKFSALNDVKEKVEKIIEELQDSTEPCPLGFSNCFSTKEELMEEIEKIGNSAAAVLCRISRGVPFQEPENHLMKDIIGVVALLGSVCCRQLSRILSEYLGADQMLAVVSRSFEAAAALEKYEQNGEVDRGRALHAEAATTGKSLSGRFLVICLEDVSPFVGGFEGGGFQRKLALPLPYLLDGAIPKGFLGFAVNMIDLDMDELGIMTNSGHDLRETLFYHLFGELHVYRTREDMLASRACIKHGAVSLDGGILKQNGAISLGFGDLGVCFQVVPTKNVMLFSQENLKRLEEKKSQMRAINDLIGKSRFVHGKLLKKFRKRLREYTELMDNFDTILKH
ncbi:hypothetical protein PanWU01x14_068990 [Parasponia andersonii]|uniref:Uncharacterized protein n=1 Tax=Parasponia andersonii TaxID=3476 RepID=A0A2P5DFK5_PARAD|nr:hypothetical protein PanWU01x14_068990 [Parasponia andersonii]